MKIWYIHDSFSLYKILQEYVSLSETSQISNIIFEKNFKQKITSKCLLINEINCMHFYKRRKYAKKNICLQFRNKALIRHLATFSWKISYTIIIVFYWKTFLCSDMQLFFAVNKRKINIALFTRFNPLKTNIFLIKHKLSFYIRTKFFCYYVVKNMFFLKI